MSSGQGGNRWNIDRDFEVVDDAGVKVTLNFHSYDQSEAFSDQPDVDEFHLTIIELNGITRHHHNEYEG